MAGTTKSVPFSVFRFDPRKDEEPHYQDYDVPVEDGWTVLQAVIYIKEQLDGTLGVRYSCRSGICGSDGMVINGMSRLACKTQIAYELQRRGRITLEPLRNLPILRDLAVRQDVFFEKFKAVSPWLINEEEPPEGARPMIMSDQDFGAVSNASDCILCQICYSECPMEGIDQSFVGPAALARAYRFEADPRDHGTNERMEVLDDQYGVWRCHTAFRCTEACPKGIDITWDIQQLKNKATRRRLGLH